MDKENTTAKACPHYWKIDVQSGTKSRGVCKLCGEVREFSNVIDMAPARSQRPTPR